MCFAPQADLVGGLVVGAVGIDAVRHVDHRPGHVALAALPLVLGAHQVVEAGLWWQLEGHLPHAMGRAALWIYLLVALVVLPLYVPAAVLALERAGPRRWKIVPFVALGTAVAVTLLVAMVRGPIDAHLGDFRLRYSIGPSPGVAITILYIVAVCGALLLSGNRVLVAFGLANLVVLPVIAWLAVDAFASLWCFYAALTSGVVALAMRWGRTDRRRKAALALGS